jgi:glucosyl-3-phosphoglycerate synthase
VDLAACLTMKQVSGQRISVCLPARNEERTVGAIVDTIVRDLVERHSLVDEVLVLDDGSDDATGIIAEAAGAVVIEASSVLASFGPTLGKGDVLWRSLAASSGDLVVWCDADLLDFGSSFVVGLVAPLLADPAVAFVKGTYERPEHGGGGGRVTELLARPLLRILRPELAYIRQPLGGEYAGRRSVLEQQYFEVDYGVEIGLLLDIADNVGVQAITQAELGVRHHRNRPLHELSVQATSVASALLRRCTPTEHAVQSTIDATRGGSDEPTVPCPRPPIAQLRGIGTLPCMATEPARLRRTMALP